MNFEEFLTNDAPMMEEGKKPLPMDKMLMKAYSKDKKAESETDENKKRKLEDQARMIQMHAYESKYWPSIRDKVDKDKTDPKKSKTISYKHDKRYKAPSIPKKKDESDALDQHYLYDTRGKKPWYEEGVEPLKDLFDLYESEVSLVDKPDLTNPSKSFGMGAPTTGSYEHPVIQSRNSVDQLRDAGVPIEIAHQAVKGQVDTGNIQSKADLASTLGRVQDGSQHNNIMVDKNSEFKSVMATDAAIEKKLDQVTRNDLRTPMPSQVPDYQQTPSQEVAEELETAEEYDYNLDVQYLQVYGRA